MKTVKLNARQLNRLVSGIIKEERARLAGSSGSKRTVKLTEATLRRIIREELSDLQPKGTEFKMGHGKRGPLAGTGVSDADIDSIVAKISELDLSDEDVEEIFSRIKSENRRRRGRRL